MRAYKIEIGRESRLIVHCRGLPPEWKETNIDRETEDRAIEKGMHDRVVHLNPETFDVIAHYPIK